MSSGAKASVKSPRFLGQAVLILLPVVVVSGIALAAIVQDRAAVEAQARREAEVLVRRLEEGVGPKVAQDLSLYDRFSYQWSASTAFHFGGWPGSSHRDFWAGEKTGYARMLQEWRASFPFFQPEQVLPNELFFEANGSLRSPQPMGAAPGPPPWLEELSHEQRTLWDQARRAEAAGQVGELCRLVEAFLESNPPREAALNARFLAWRVGEASNTPVQAALTGLSWDDYQLPSDGGLPLGSLVFAEEVRRARESGFTQALWERMGEQVHRTPSCLTPLLLDQAEVLAGTNTTLVDGVRAWRALWGCHERLRRLAALIAPHLRGVTTTNLWIEAEGVRWFCILKPTERITYTGGPRPETNRTPVTEARLYPKPDVGLAFARAMKASAGPLPAYLGLSASLEGEPLGQELRAPVLAESRGRLSREARMLLDDHRAGQELVTGPEFESLPSHPRFAVAVHLADPAALYGAYRRRAWLLGGLVAVSGFAALAGVAGAWRGFKRQVELYEAKSNFVSSVSHELRAPLASVRLLTESLEKGKVSDPARQREYFRFILQECRRLSTLVENVLDFSRIEQGRKQYDFELTDAAALVRGTVHLMVPYAAEKQVLLALDRPNGLDEAVEIMADGHALQQALVNLIDNAIKHSRAGESVTVLLERVNATQPPLLRVSVSDHGPGIPAEEHERIFERFYRRGSELRRETPGVGIGLSIVKHVAEAHGGRVRLESAPGRGSRFMLELPVRQEPANDRNAMTS